MARRILGLDLGTSALKAVWTESSYRQTAVRGYRRVQLPPEFVGENTVPYAERLRVGLEELLTRGGENKADAVYTALPGRITSTHLVELPFSDPRRIEQTLPFELEDLLPFNLDEVIFDHQILQRGPDGSQVLVTVVLRKVFEEILTTLHDVGLDPRSVTHSALAYQNLFAAGIAAQVDPPLDGEPVSEAILDVGAGSTELLFLQDAKVRGAQSFPLAGDAITRAVALGEAMGRDEAEDLKIRRASLLVAPGDEEAARLSLHLQKGLGPLVRGVRQSFFAYRARAQAKVSRVHLCGGSAQIPGLARHLSRELNCKIVLLDPFPDQGMQVEVEPEAHDDPTAGLAMALALQSSSREQVNLRIGDFHFQGDLSYLRHSVGKLAALAVVVLGLLGLNVYASFATLSAREAQVDDALCRLTEKVLGECTTNADDAISRLKGSKVGEGSVPEVAAGEVLVAVTDRLKRVKGIDLTELDIGSTKIRLGGEADSFDKVSKVVEALQDYPCFSEVSQGQTRQARKTDRIEFNVDASLTEGCVG